MPTLKVCTLSNIRVASNTHLFVVSTPNGPFARPEFALHLFDPPNKGELVTCSEDGTP